MFEEQTMDDGTGTYVGYIVNTNASCCIDLILQMSAVAVDWTEASVKKCFSLFVTLLPLNHKLLRE